MYIKIYIFEHFLIILFVQDSITLASYISELVIHETVRISLQKLLKTLRRIRLLVIQLFCFLWSMF